MDLNVPPVVQLKRLDIELVSKADDEGFYQYLVWYHLDITYYGGWVTMGLLNPPKAPFKVSSVLDTVEKMREFLTAERLSEMVRPHP